MGMNTAAYYQQVCVGVWVFVCGVTCLFLVKPVDPVTAWRSRYTHRFELVWTGNSSRFDQFYISVM